MKIIPGNLLKNLEKSWKYHGILSARKSGNPGLAQTNLITYKKIDRNVSDDSEKIPFLCALLFSDFGVFWQNCQEGIC